MVGAMQRNFLRGLLICLIPCLLAAVFAVRPDKYKLGIDLAGGTILVYEINLERSYQRKVVQAQAEGKPPPSREDQGLDPSAMNELAAQIKRRIDPTDIKNVTVRPVGRTRFEIILPKSGAASGRENLSSEEIEEVKRLISQMGVLEFRIIANGTDDLEGIIAARALLDGKSPEARPAGRRRWGWPRKGQTASLQSTSAIPPLASATCGWNWVRNIGPIWG